MIYKDTLRDIAAAGLLVCSFWNILYPEYTFAGDAYQKIEDGTPVESTDNVKDYYQILDAGKGEVTIRFSFMEKEKGKKADLSGKREEGSSEASPGFREDDQVKYSAGVEW